MCKIEWIHCPFCDNKTRELVLVIQWKEQKLLFRFVKEALKNYMDGKNVKIYTYMSV